MAQAKEGDTVKVHYTGKLGDGTVFDSSVEREPLEFTLGRDQVIEGFEKAVVGMEVDESKTVHIPCDQAYGSYREDMIVGVDRGQFPPHIKPEVGQELQVQREGGQVFLVKVLAVTEAEVTLDGNHPLAGEDLTFDLQLVEIA
jgi:FKBP-type peptidyl-prolyl cis-trans isomerase 2